MVKIKHLIWPSSEKGWMQTHAGASFSVQHMRVGVTFRYINLRFTSVPARNCNFHEEIAWRWRNVLQISPKHLQEEGETHTAAWRHLTRSELLMPWRSLHASVIDETGSTSLSVLDAPVHCHTDGHQRSRLYVHVVNKNAAHSRLTVRVMAEAED